MRSRRARPLWSGTGKVLTVKRTEKSKTRDVTAIFKSMISIIEEDLENLKEGRENKSDQLLKENRVKFSKCVPDDEMQRR